MIVGPQGPSKVGRCQIYSNERGVLFSDAPLSLCEIRNALLWGRCSDVFELTAKLAGPQIRLLRKSGDARWIAEIRRL